MSDAGGSKGMSAAVATRLEYFIIGIGVAALLLIFQPISLSLFGVGCAMVVLAGLANNLLPLCEPGVQPRTVITAALIVAVIFVVVLGIALLSAYLYGRLFIGTP
jgi:hypothetical protein